jgi:antitoxin PrlF
MAFAKLTSKGQLTVPKEVREDLGLQPGDRVSILPNGKGTATMRKALSVQDLFGRFPTNGVTATVEEMNEAAQEEAVEGVMRSMRP